MVVLRAPTCFVLRDASLAALLGDPDVLLPLPFTREADPADVLAHLRRLNPHRTVRFDPLSLGGDGQPDYTAHTSRPPAGRSPLPPCA